MSEHGIAQSLIIIASFQHGDQPSAADFIRRAFYLVRHVTKTFRGYFYVGQGIPLMRVESR